MAEEYSIPKVKIENSIIEMSNPISIEESLLKIFRRIYEIRKDNRNLREIFNMKKDEAGKYFDRLRKDYQLRYEFANYSVIIQKENKVLIDILSALGFEITCKEDTSSL